MKYPISYSFILTGKLNSTISIPIKDISNFIILTYYLTRAVRFDFTEDRQYCVLRLETPIPKLNYCGVTWRTWRERLLSWKLDDDGILQIDAAKQGVLLIEADEMEELIEKLQGLSSRRLNTVMRLYFYIYRNDVVFEGLYQASEAAMAADLELDVMTVSRNLTWLINNHLIERSGKYMFSGENPFAYAYNIKKKVLD